MTPDPLAALDVCPRCGITRKQLTAMCGEHLRRMGGEIDVERLAEALPSWLLDCDNGSSWDPEYVAGKIAREYAATAEAPHAED